MVKTPSSIIASQDESSDATQHLWTRRDFFGYSSLIGLGATLLGGLYISLRTLWPKPGKASALRLEAGRPEAMSQGQVNETLYKDHGLWIIRTKTGLFALSSRCTHLGCKVRYVKSQKQFHCMCHGSLFDSMGQVVRGPAPRSLERVFISLSKSGIILVDPDIRYRQERGEWNLKGAFLQYTKTLKR